MEEVNKPLKDWELSRLAQRMSPPEFEQIAVGYLGLPKVRLAQCERNSGNNSVAYMTNSLLSWRDSTPHNKARQILYTQLSKAADRGLVGKTCIQFLITGEEDEIQECVEVPKWYLRCWRKCDNWLNLLFVILISMNVFKIQLIIVMTLMIAKYSWPPKLEQMTSTLTRNLVKMDNLFPSLDEFHIFALTTVIINAGFIIDVIVFIFLHQYIALSKMKRLSYTLILSGPVYVILVMLVMLIMKFVKFVPVHISESTLEKPMMLSLDSYSTYPEVAKSWDQLQVGYECCGVHNCSDWFGMPLHEHLYDSYKPGSPDDLPDSCCKQLTVGCGRNITNLENIYPTGCMNNLSNHILINVENQIESLELKWIFGYLGIHIISFIGYCTVSYSFRRSLIWLDGKKDKRQLYNRNNDIENTPLLENNVSNDIEINIEDEGADTEVLINFSDNEENECSGNQVSSVNMGTTVIHAPDVHRVACAYSDDHALLDTPY